MSWQVQWSESENVFVYAQLIAAGSELFHMTVYQADNIALNHKCCYFRIKGSSFIHLNCA